MVIDRDRQILLLGRLRGMENDVLNPDVAQRINAIRDATKQCRDITLPTASRIACRRRLKTDPGASAEF